MKTYTYQVFLRHPETKEVQWGKVQFDAECALNKVDIVLVNQGLSISNLKCTTEVLKEKENEI